MNTVKNPANSPDVSMNIRRFVAENSRTALRQVREALGGDAIILANRSIDGGVEVLAAAPAAVDALTRRMTAPTASSLPIASPIALATTVTAPITPAELGLQPTGDGQPTPLSAHRKRLTSLFSRRTATAEAPPPAVPAAAEAVDAYTRDFAAELAAATTVSEDFITAFAPEAIARSRPQPVQPQPTSPQPAPMPRPAPPVALASLPPAEPIVAPPSPADIADVVAREVRRELGRDVINDLTRDVSENVTRDVTNNVTRDVTRLLTRDVTQSVAGDVTRDVTREIRAMQATLTEQLTTLTWTDSMRRQPGRTKLMQDLIQAGFSPALSRHIQERLPDDFSSDEASAWAQSILRRNLPVAADAEELINEGGVFALVGPTGVGKTTTVAKLAARFAMKHGVDQLALITTDGFRIGAQDQLRIYGKILGVPVHSIHDPASLNSAIAHLADKKLVLIDTAGLGQRDERVAEQIAMLRGAKAKRLVVLNATVDGETLDHVVGAFADRDFAGCVITKTDEAARLGPVLDAVIRHRLKIHHVSTGQKVPEDLERPDVARLVQRAMTRPAARPAFEVTADDQPVWMSAMTERATPLDASTLDVDAGRA